MADLSILIDVSKCTGCRGCQAACKEWNQLPGDIKPFNGSYQTQTLSPTTYTYVQFKERVDNGKVKWSFAKTQCMHCTDAACVKVCPSGALAHTSEGTVLRDMEKCIGCGYCVYNCPYGVPRLDETLKKATQCTFCYDRVTKGDLTACAKACPTGALQFGPRNQLLALGRERLNTLKADNPKANLYGENVVGGSHVLYLLDEKPEFYEFPSKAQVPPSVGIWKNLVQPGGKWLIGAALAGSIIGFFTTRVSAVEKETARQKGSEEHGG